MSRELKDLLGLDFDPSSPSPPPEVGPGLDETVLLAKTRTQTTLSALTRAAAGLPEAERTTQEFALTALDLFDDAQIAILQMQLCAGASARRREELDGLEIPRPVRGLPTEPAKNPVKWSGYDREDPRWPGYLVSMVWSPTAAMIAGTSLPAVVGGRTDAGRCIGTTAQWVRARVKRAEALGAKAVLLSACGTRALVQLDDGIAWKVEQLQEA